MKGNEHKLSNFICYSCDKMLQIHPYSIEVKLIKEEILKNLKIDQNSLPIYQNPLPTFKKERPRVN